MEFPSDETAFPFQDTMSNGNTTTVSHRVNPSTLRVRRYRERCRERICCLTVEMHEADIAEAIARGLLKSDGDAWITRRLVCGPFVGRGIAMARQQQSDQIRTVRRRGLDPSQHKRLAGAGWPLDRPLENGSNTLHGYQRSRGEGDMTNRQTTHVAPAVPIQRAG